MRLYLFPITRQQTLIYCKRAKPLVLPTPPSSTDTTPSSSSSGPTPPSPKPPLLDRITTRANSTWQSWEAKPSGWQKKVTTYGNHLFSRIPYTEWGLKSIPPLSRARIAEDAALSSLPKDDVKRRAAQVDLVYPTDLYKESEIKGLLEKMARENQAGYKRKLIWSVVAMPFTAPFALVPIVPNLPFFYLVFRAWSYWRAGNGCRHIEHLVKRDLVRASPSQVLQRLWDMGPVEKAKVDLLEEQVRALRGVDADGKPEAEKKAEPEDAEVEALAMDILGKGEARVAPPSVSAAGDREILYPKGHGKVVGLTLNMPEVEVEMERAYDQVTRELSKDKQALPGNTKDQQQ